jgi:hypothetical protein
MYEDFCRRIDEDFSILSEKTRNWIKGKVSEIADNAFERGKQQHAKDNKTAVSDNKPAHVFQTDEELAAWLKENICVNHYRFSYSCNVEIYIFDHNIFNENFDCYHDN